MPIGRWLGSAVLLALLAVPARAADRAGEVTALVLATGPDTAQVALSFGQVVDHAQLRSELAALARDTGASFTAVSIREEPLLRGEAARGTSADFRATGLLRRGAPLPVEAFARTFAAGGRHLQLAFAPGAHFVFAGPEQGTAAGRPFHFLQSGGTYTYDVGGMDREAAGRAEPGVGSESPTGGAGEQARGLQGGIRNILLGLSVLLLVIAAWILSQPWRKSLGRPRG